MAKDKKDTLALFEVIRDDKRGGKKDPALQTPKWWKREPGSAHVAPAGTGATHVGAAASPAMASRKGVWFRLTGAHLAVAGIALVLVVGIAYWIGRGPHAPEGPSSADLKKQPANPSVLVVDRDGPANQTPDAEQPPVPGRSGEAPARQDGSRVAGRNYIIAQSYPNIVEANAACEYLVKAGIPCTVEKKLPYAPSWYCVVTTTGFEKVSSRDYEEYARRIQTIGAKYSGTKFRKFNPQAFRWG